MEFLRRKICFSVDVAVISGGLEPDVDVFVLSDGADEKYVKGLIRDFKVK
jgi:hypothetical protein